jgi:MFS family permease
LELAPFRWRGTAGGILTASVFLGQFCSPLVSTSVIASYGYKGLFSGAALFVGAMALAIGLKAGAARSRVVKGRVRNDGVIEGTIRPDIDPSAFPRSIINGLEGRR